MSKELHLGEHQIERSIASEVLPIPGLESAAAAAIQFVTASPAESDSKAAQPASRSRAPRLPGPESAVRRMRSQVEQLTLANRRKDEFLAMLGHELRCPLASIRNGIQLLSHHGECAPELQRARTMIERQLGRLTQLVDDLLDVSRIAHGGLHLRRERLDLRDVVSNAIETLESDINQRNHRLSIVLPDTPVWLQQADAGRLEQVFVNLLANASKYTDENGELSVCLHVQDGEAVVRVRDTGIGIAPEALPNVFDLFNRANESAARARSGLGVGLALARALVESHGGSLSGASAGLGQGSEFTVRLASER
jgi:signal transduction histidine kinase